MSTMQLTTKAAMLVAVVQRTLGAGENHKMEIKPADLSIMFQRDQSVASNPSVSM